MRTIVEDAHELARNVITENLDELHIIGKGLLEFETLSGDEIIALLKGVRPVREDLTDPPASSGPSSSVPSSGPTSSGMDPSPQGT